MRISVDTERCVGAGQCVLTAPDVFDQSDDGLVVVLADPADGPADGPADEAMREAVREAVRLAGSVCPSGAITVREDGPASAP
ncbi:ferredoxin [Streptomyces sp. NPDC093109]|uniref:ferredoxin n=1 Tax=Streptomyces sp. NPDC093109 TaxID=3154977 RepID=UPI00344E8387